IFVTMIPVLAMLKAGHDGPFAPLLGLVSTDDERPVNAAYFWLTGVLSSFLDNAPTYLAFFNLAGGDAQQLMGPARLDSACHLGWRGIHGRQHLYRQRAQLHGALDLRGAWHQDAELHRLHAVVWSDPVAAVCRLHLAMVLVSGLRVSA